MSFRPFRPFDPLRAVVGQATAFNPLSGSPGLWLDAALDSTLFNAVSGGSLPANAQEVLRWEDRSTNGRNYTQGTVGERPTRRTNVQNGLPSVRFDGSNDNMLMVSGGLGLLRNVPGATLIAAYRWLTNPATNSTVANFLTNGVATRALISGGFPSSRKLVTGGRRLDADVSFHSASSTADNPTTCFVHSGVLDYANSDCYHYINGALDGSNTSFQTSGNTSTTDSLLASIGSFGGSSTPSNIDFHELFVFPRALGSTERAAYEAYLVAKWGI